MEIPKCPRQITAVELEIGQVWIAVRVSGGDGCAAEVVWVVAVDGAFHLVVVARGEGAGSGGGVYGCLVDAEELVVGCDALGDVEGVEGYVARVVVGEESGGDDGLGVGCGDVEGGCDTGLEGSDGCERVGRERGAVVGDVAEDDGDVSCAGVLVADDQLLGVDKLTVLDNVSSYVTQTHELEGWIGFEAGDLVG